MNFQPPDSCREPKRPVAVFRMLPIGEDRPTRGYTRRHAQHQPECSGGPFVGYRHDVLCLHVRSLLSLIG